VRLGERDLPYLLKRSAKRRRMVLMVDERGLVLHVPWRASERHIAQVIAQAQSWILRKVAEWERKKPRARSWVGGEPIDFLGRQLTLQLQTRDGPAIAQLRDGNALELSLPAPHTPERVREAVVSWYRRHAGSHFPERVQHFCAQLEAPAPRVLLSSARTRWGSCNADGEIRLNWRLMQAAGHVIDYVVAHEVAHLKVMSHSTRFWRTVQRLYPDYAAAKAELSAMSQHFMAL
jgi:hypothetical protein